MWLHIPLKNLFKCCNIVAGVQYIESDFGIDLVKKLTETDVSTNTAVVIFTVKVTGNCRGVVS
jgi:hypothetical protein